MEAGLTNQTARRAVVLIISMDETVDNKDERLPGTTSKSDCLIQLIRVDFQPLDLPGACPFSRYEADRR